MEFQRHVYKNQAHFPQQTKFEDGYSNSSKGKVDESSTAYQCIAMFGSLKLQADMQYYEAQASNVQ